MRFIISTFLLTLVLGISLHSHAAESLDQALVQAVRSRNMVAIEKLFNDKLQLKEYYDLDGT